ncbi:hypothetical protein ACIPLC_35375 [Kitasatospora sp. NPDC086801]|uniref:hypothetical protein n=1 Tax=Kitasatospora sp. NPDC086801 TaxID=3364066 RepID=UPI00382113A6
MEHVPPAEDLDTLLGELVATARGAVALDNLAPIALLLTQWRHSAEVYADPALLALYRRRRPPVGAGAVPEDVVHPETAVDGNRSDRLLGGEHVAHDPVDRLAHSAIARARLHAAGAREADCRGAAMS